MAEEFSYHIKLNARSKSIKLRVEADGKILVTAHPFTPKFVIDKFVAENKEWIVDKLDKLPKKIDETGVVYFLGREMPVEWWPSETTDNVEYFEPSLIIKTKSDQKEAMQALVKKWLVRQAKRILTKKVDDLATMFDLPYQKVRIGSAKSRWGSCTADGTISLNYKLITLKPELADYVICHELAHLLEMNHSAKFWAEVGKMYPQFKSARAELKKSQVVI